MSCKMKIEQLKEAISNGNEEVKSGIVFYIDSLLLIRTFGQEHFAYLPLEVRY